MLSCNILLPETPDINLLGVDNKMLDANALYAWAMSKPLPTGVFKWLKEDKWDDIIKNKEGIGYFVECDLEYPKELHDLHNGYPLAPEKLIIQDDWLSPFCKNT